MKANKATGSPRVGGPLAEARKRLTKPARRRLQTAAAREAAHRVRPVTITLRFRHRIASAPEERRRILPSGKYVYDTVEGTGGMHEYGPGTIRVRADVAAALMEQERNAMTVIANETTERAFLIRPQGGITKLTEVPPEMFADYMGIVQPFR